MKKPKTCPSCGNTFDQFTFPSSHCKVCAIKIAKVAFSSHSKRQFGQMSNYYKKQIQKGILPGAGINNYTHQALTGKEERHQSKCTVCNDPNCTFDPNWKDTERSF